MLLRYAISNCVLSITGHNLCRVTLLACLHYLSLFIAFFTCLDVFLCYVSHRDHQTDEPEDSPIAADVSGSMFSFWNDFLHEKFSEEGDGVLLALGSLRNSITGT